MYLYIRPHVTKEYFKEMVILDLSPRLMVTFRHNFLLFIFTSKLYVLLIVRLDVTNRRKIRGKDDWLLNPTDTKLYQRH